MSKKNIIILAVIGGVVLLSLIGTIIFFNATPAGRRVWGGYENELQTS